MDFPLTVRRRLHVVDSSSSTAVVATDEVEKSGATPDWDLHQRFVIDRSSLESVRDDRAYAYEPGNTVDRSPYYTVSFPFNAGGGPYQVWQDEIGTACPFSPDGAAVRRYGLDLHPLRCDFAKAPVRPYFVDRLTAWGLPKQVALRQIAPQLAAAGIDLQQLAAQVLPRLSVSDRSAILSILGRPIGLSYLLDTDIRVLVEPDTGSVVALDRTTKTIFAQLDISGVSDAEVILTKPSYAATPAVVAAVATLRRLITRPPTAKVLTSTYSQTPQSVDDAASYVRRFRHKTGFVERIVAYGMLVIGAAIISGGARAGRRVRRRQRQGGL
jgi:hypothetical protein